MVYVCIFLKDSLIRKFGSEFYEALCASAEYQNKKKEKNKLLSCKTLWKKIPFQQSF